MAVQIHSLTLTRSVRFLMHPKGTTLPRERPHQRSQIPITDLLSIDVEDEKMIAHVVALHFLLYLSVRMIP
jgi:hypothetical protein